METDFSYFIFCQKRIIIQLIETIGRWDAQQGGRLKTAFSDYFARHTGEPADRKEIILGALMGYVYDLCTYIDDHVAGDVQFGDVQGFGEERVSEMIRDLLEEEEKEEEEEEEKKRRIVMSKNRDDGFVTAKYCWYVCGEGALVHNILLSLATQDADRADALRGLFRELFDRERMALGDTAREWQNDIMSLASEAAHLLAGLLNPERKAKEFDNVSGKLAAVPASEHYARSVDEMIAALWQKLEGESEK